MPPIQAVGGYVSHIASPLKAFKRTKSLDTSTWYMASLTTYLVEKTDTNGGFALMEALLVPGNEPPPHVHSREDELFYVLEGEFDVYVGTEAFKVETGACVFLPKLKPHAFVIRSPKLRLLVLLAPGGLEAAFRGMASPAQRLELPTGMRTYSQSDLAHTVQVFEAYGVTLLSAAEIERQLPQYPKLLPANARE
jgi:mannose-6-phosphate isomerase-like protein (cupin superfamily)